MTLHLRKLAVGVADLADLDRRIALRLRDRRDRHERPALRHGTRHRPKRCAELLDGGSLYWVVAGVMAARSPLLAIEDTRGDAGKRCTLVLEPRLIRTEPRPHRPFQGWRYLEQADAPPDLDERDAEGLPPPLADELKALGLI